MCVGLIERDNGRELQWIRAASRCAFAFCKMRSESGFFAERARKKKNRQVKIFSDYAFRKMRSIKIKANREDPLSRRMLSSRAYMI